MANRSRCCARGGQSASPSPRRRARGGPAFKELAAVAVRSRHLLAENLGDPAPPSCSSWTVKRLPVGGDAGIAETAVLHVSSGHIFLQM
jgi:hypothetical protein